MSKRRLKVLIVVALVAVTTVAVVARFAVTAVHSGDYQFVMVPPDEWGFGSRTTEVNVAWDHFAKDYPIIFRHSHEFGFFEVVTYSTPRR